MYRMYGTPVMQEQLPVKYRASAGFTDANSLASGRDCAIRSAVGRGTVQGNAGAITGAVLRLPLLTVAVATVVANKAAVNQAVL